MNDTQFLKFVNILDEKLQAMKTGIVNDLREGLMLELEPRFQDLEGKIDWIIGALDHDENERLALGFNFDRKHAAHERRIATLELASGH